MLKHAMLALGTATPLVAPVGAQTLPVYTTSGTLELTLGDKQLTHYTTSNTVPTQPGRQVHNASWIVLEPKLLGGINIIPDDVFVTVNSRESVQPQPSQASLTLEFSLRPDTLELKTETPYKVSFHPAGGQPGEYYVLTEGTLEIEKANKTSEDTLSLLGSVRGVLTLQTGSKITHNPKDALDFTARFDLQNVSRRGR